VAWKIVTPSFTEMLSTLTDLANIAFWKRSGSTLIIAPISGSVARWPSRRIGSGLLSFTLTLRRTRSGAGLAAATTLCVVVRFWFFSLLLTAIFFMRYDTIPKGLQVNSCRAQQEALLPCSIVAQAQFKICSQHC
jgi:hypothetical protein